MTESIIGSAKTNYLNQAIFSEKTKKIAGTTLKVTLVAGAVIAGILACPPLLHLLHLNFHAPQAFTHSQIFDISKYIFGSAGFLVIAYEVISHNKVKEFRPSTPLTPETRDDQSIDYHRSPVTIKEEKKKFHNFDKVKTEVQKVSQHFNDDDLQCFFEVGRWEDEVNLNSSGGGVSDEEREIQKNPEGTGLLLIKNLKKNGTRYQITFNTDTQTFWRKKL